MKSNVLPSDLGVEDLDLESLSDTELEILGKDLYSFLIQKAREDVNVFCALHFRKPPHPMHMEFQRLVEEHNKVMIAAMRGSGKSTQITTLRTLWELGNNPGLRFKIICARQGKAKDYVGEVAKHITDCPQGVCQLVFPDLKKDPNRSWSGESINVIRPPTEIDTRDASVEAWGITSSPEGSRADRLVFDDIVTENNSIGKPKDMERIKKTFAGTWMDLKAAPATDKDNPTQFWYMTTLWHPQDASHEIIRNPAWDHFIFSISEDFSKIETNYGKTLPLPYPAGRGQWDREALVEEYKSRGPLIFNRSFRQKVITEEELLFFPEMFDGKDGAIQYGLSPHNKKFQKFPKYVGIDIASSKGARASESAIFTIAVADGSDHEDGDKALTKGTRIPIDIRSGKWSSPETARHLVDIHNTYRPELFMVESNATQIAIAEWLEDIEGVSLPMEGHFTGSQKMSEDFGIPLLSSEFERGLWLVPIKDTEPHNRSECPCSYCKWINQMLNFTGASSSDTDIVMSCWFAQRAIKQREQYGGYYGTWSF